MNTKLESHGLFHTPASAKELENWIERHNAEDRIHLYTAAGMAWNLAVKLHDAQLEKLTARLRHLADTIEP